MDWKDIAKRLIRVGFFAVTWLTIMKVSFIIELGYVLLLLFLAEICIDYKSKLSRNIGIGVIIIFILKIVCPFNKCCLDS